MGKCGWEGHKQNMTEGNRAEDPENVRQKDGRSIIRQAVLALLLCSVAALVACTPVKEPERKEKKVLQLWHYWDREESRQCLAKLVQKFNDTHQDVEIQINYIADEDFKKRLVLAAADGEQPDLAIVFEGSPADDFYFSAEKSQGGMHKGVQIRCMDKSYITNPAFLEYAHELGGTMGITYQDAVRRGGSTNAGKISLAGKAVPTLVLGIPSRYVHSHYNFCAIEDVESTVRMAVEVIKGLNEERIKHLMHQDIL